jgi:hypothetical protein
MLWDYIAPIALTAGAVLLVVLLARRGVGT